jgi:hypothetical protein
VTDEFEDYLADAKRNTEFRTAFERAQRRPRWHRWLMELWARRPWGWR